MRRWRLGGVIVGVLALVAWGVLRGGGSSGPSTPEQATRATATPRTSRASITPPSQRPGAGLHLRGTVVDAQGAPVAGAHVSASWPEPGQTLSELPCPEGALEPYEDPRDPSTRGRTLPQCMSHVTALVMELVGAREGEAPVYAEATTGADGTFLLEALPEGPLALWALGEHGAVMRAGIPAGAEDVKLVLGEGLLTQGLVVGDGAPLAGATVTVLNALHTRYFDATTGADGRFRVGPLPMGMYFVFVAKDGWFPELVLRNGEPEQEVTLHRSRRLSGRVRSGGAPVPGLEVRVASGADIPDDTARSITTDADGRFSLMLPEGPHTLSASREGRYALAHATAGAATPEVVLELGSALHVEGTVSDDAGRPVAGARVEASWLGESNANLHAVTGADGHYHLGPVEPGEWSFTVKASGYVDPDESEERMLDAATGPVDFRLPRAAIVTGRVTDAEGRPLPDLAIALVRPTPPESPWDEPQEDTWTDAEGRFVLDAKAPGDYRIDVSAESFIEESFPVRAPSTDVHLTLRTGASLEGTVVDAQGLPLEDFLVELQDPEGREELSLRTAGYTDKKGRFLLRGVEPGRYLLLASRATKALTRRAWGVVELRDGTRTRVVLRMEPERTLSGIVVDGAGRAVEGVYVRAWPPMKGAPVWKREGRNSRHGPPLGVETGPDGRFTLPGLTEAAYDLRLLKVGYTLDAAHSTGEPAGEAGTLLRVGAGTAEVRIVLTRYPHFIGRLVGPDGAPLRSFRVNGSPREAGDGAFAVAGEDAADEPLVFEADGLASLVREVRPLTGDADVDLGVVRMGRGRTLRGRVVDAETSKPLPGVVVMHATRSTGAAKRPVAISTAITRKDGTFELHNLTPEALTLIVNHLGYRQQQLTVGPEQEELALRLAPGPRVEVTIKDAQGRPLTAQVRFNRDDGDTESASAEKGRLVQLGLEPGPYTVELEESFFNNRLFPVFPPQRVVVPESGLLQVHFQE
jgi:protocatechuate 3,4-dioxygenase beta subunit